MQLCGRALLSAQSLCLLPSTRWVGDTHAHMEYEHVGVCSSQTANTVLNFMYYCVSGNTVFLSGFVSFCFVCALFCRLKMESHLCLSRDRRWLNLSVGCAELTSDLTSTPVTRKVQSSACCVLGAAPHWKFRLPTPEGLRNSLLGLSGGSM